MKRLASGGGPRTVRPLWLAVFAAAITIAAVLAATQANPAANAAAKPHTEKVKKPKLRHGELSVEGTNGDDRIALRQQGTTIVVDFGDDGTADFDFPRAAITSIVVDAENGDDFVRADDSGGVFTDAIPTTLGGGNGDDELRGASGGETLEGGNGDDLVDGNRGNDTASLGGNDDAFVWDPGDGSDTIEGDGGIDTMRFNGANVAELIDLSANGNRLRFTRNIASIAMDTHGVEHVAFAALGGADVVTVNPLAGTGVARVDVDLAATGGAGDGAADRVVVNGTAGDDTIEAHANGDATEVTGTGATVATRGAEEANDRVELDGLAGNDRIAINGSEGADTIGLVGDGTGGGLATGFPAVVAVNATDPVSVNGLGGNDTLVRPAATSALTS